MTRPDLDRSCPMNTLPASVFQQIALLLPDPGPLAATCRSLASQLEQQALLLEWAEVWAPKSTNRHAGYALLHWRRVQWPDLGRLVLLLTRSSHRSLAHGSLTRVKQFLEQGDDLAALEELLPHSQHLLLLYAAQAGHMPLLGQILAGLMLRRA